jgi:hypothetical protein
VATSAPRYTGVQAACGLFVEEFVLSIGETTDDLAYRPSGYATGQAAADRRGRCRRLTSDEKLSPRDCVGRPRPEQKREILTTSRQLVCLEPDNAVTRLRFNDETWRRLDIRTT